ncbi:MAG: hypothetical protein OXU26_03470 [Acidobacteriota bacterium]|nr:hypothetical protein [Acidobacteriota bacterium]
MWEDRKGRQPYAVVALAPSDDPDKLQVAGPQDARPVRQLPAHRVYDLLVQSRGRAPREAAAFLTREFSRLEEAVVPGVRVKDLLTPHFLRDRLPGPASARHLPELVKSVARPQSLSWRSLFQALGFQVQRLPQRGYLLRVDNAPVAVVHPLADPSLFSRLTDNGELPEGMVLADCEKQGAHWGILAAGARYRLFQRKPPVGPATGQYLEIDMAELESQDRWYLGLLAPDSLRDNGWLPAWIQEARDFGEQLREGLQERLIKDALPNIARGLGEYLESEGADLGDRKQLQRIEEAALTLVFRFMFLLHTEARGYLPIGSAAYRPRSASQLADDSRPGSGPFGRRSTQRWDRLRTLVRMVRAGDPSTGVPAYNGSLFAPSGFPGSDLLEKAEVSDTYLAPALSAIAYDDDRPESSGLDYAGLQIGHLGAIYEALLTLRLTRAPEDLAYDARRDIYRPLRAGEQPAVTRADLYYQAQAGGRQAAGVFYTRHEFVDHLLQHSLRPALDDHLVQIRGLAERNADQAARQLFDFSVIDPAMGSAHFLTAALDMMADRIELFLAEVGGLPGIAGQLGELRQDTGPTGHQPEDGDLLRRLILKRCIFGVDLSAMAVEVANVTLWLASFVPGLALSYLGSNLKWGDALIGVANPSVLSEIDRDRMFTGGRQILDAMERAARLQLELAQNPDRTPMEVSRSESLASDLREATIALRNAFDVWAAEPLGLQGARGDLQLHGQTIVSGKRLPDYVATQVEKARHFASRHHFFHWPLEFPSLFHRKRPGFDVVVGNPPWNEVTVEELAFYALRDPGLRGIRSLTQRRTCIDALDDQNPTWRDEFETQKRDLAAIRNFFGENGGYQLQGVGDRDLYQLFCERYTQLLRHQGRVGVVLPRSAFLGKGATGFRNWLFDNSAVARIDFLSNSGRWAFDMEPRYTVALLAGQEIVPSRESPFQVTGPSESLNEFRQVSAKQGVSVSAAALGSEKVVPLLPSQTHAELLAKIRKGVQIDALGNPTNEAPSKSISYSFRAIPHRELDETGQRAFFSHPPGDNRVPAWRGRSFDQYDPHGKEPAGFCDWNEVLAFLQKRRVRSPVFRRAFSRSFLEDPSTHPINHCRIAYGHITNRTNSRTMNACLVPPRTPLTNAAPYLVLSESIPLLQMTVLGVINSVTFDWLGRRYVEMNYSHFIMNMLTLPQPDSTPWQRIGSLAARLSCVDERFAEFAAEANVACGPLTNTQRHNLRAEIDALVARSYDLTEDELRFIFTDFTENAVPLAYREQVLEKFESL